MDRLIDRLDESPETVTDLVDQYLVLNKLKSDADDERREISSEICDEVGPGSEISGDLGTIQTIRRESWKISDENLAIRRLQELGVNLDSVMSLDSRRVEEVLEESDVPKEEIMDLSVSTYARTKESDL